MDRIRMRAQGVKREHIESYMQELVEAGRLDSEDIYLWPYQDLKKGRHRFE